VPIILFRKTAFQDQNIDGKCQCLFI